MPTCREKRVLHGILWVDGKRSVAMKNIINEILILAGGTCIALAVSFLINAAEMNGAISKFISELQTHGREVFYFRIWAVSTFFLIGSNLIIWGLLLKIINKKS